MWPYYKGCSHSLLHVQSDSEISTKCVESLVHRYVLVKTALINDGSDACGLRTLAAHCGVCEAVCRKPYDVLYQKGTTSRV